MSFEPVATHVLATFPAFAGISGSNKTTSIIKRSLTALKFCDALLLKMSYLKSLFQGVYLL